MQESSIQINEHTIRNWVSNGFSEELVLDELRKLGVLEHEMEMHLKAYKHALFEKRKVNAFILLGASALLGLIGCIMSMINPFPDYYNLFLYGTTSIAALLAFGGLYLLLEG